MGELHYMASWIMPFFSCFPGVMPSSRSCLPTFLRYYANIHCLLTFLNSPVLFSRFEGKTITLKSSPPKRVDIGSQPSDRPLVKFGRYSPDSTPCNKTIDCTTSCISTNSYYSVTCLHVRTERCQVWALVTFRGWGAPDWRAQSSCADSFPPR